MLRDLLTYAKSLIGFAGWKFGAIVAFIVVSSPTEGVGVTSLLPTLQLAGVQIGSRSEAGRYATLVSDALGAIGLRPTLALMLALFLAIVCVRAVLSRAQGVATAPAVLMRRHGEEIGRQLFETSQVPLSLHPPGAARLQAG